MGLYPLTNKLVLCVRRKACEFLKGFTSNDLTAPRNAFLDVKGKIVAAFDQLVLNEDEVLVVIEKQFFERLLSHLDRYLKLSDTMMEKTDTCVYFDLEGDVSPAEGERVIPQKKGRLLLTKRRLSVAVSEEEFTLFRLKNGLPLQGVDYDEELLLNVSEEELVSYVKGCYLGQEIIARIHYRSKPPRRLVVKSEDELRPEERAQMTSRCVDPETGKVLGFVFTERRGR